MNYRDIQHRKFDKNRLFLSNACSNIAAMKIRSNNSAIQYALIVYLSFVLLLGQASSLHMHIQHGDGVASTGHVVEVHASSSIYDTAHNAHHPDEIQLDHHEEIQNHHDVSVDVNADSLVKKIKLINLTVLLAVIVGFILVAPRLRCISNHYCLKIKPVSSLYYLFQPPLRAPPR